MQANGKLSLECYAQKKHIYILIVFSKHKILHHWSAKKKPIWNRDKKIRRNACKIFRWLILAKNFQSWKFLGIFAGQFWRLFRHRTLKIIKTEKWQKNKATNTHGVSKELQSDAKRKKQIIVVSATTKKWRVWIW